ncbi:hypothetical protein C5142_16740 [Rhodococcus sp. BGS-1C]|uniref:hypothetical protein n=1 Tax=unclassified Rhodococcus (in: high G+C Gram-positive bacteria) TaxID=192944 RepID=UPI0019D26F1D|nr:hypothetical protein [Rhodococcus sp. KRD197]
MIAAQSNDPVRTTEGGEAGATRSEDAGANNVEVFALAPEKNADGTRGRVFMRFSPSHARNLAAQIIESAQALDNEQNPAAEKR